MDKLILFFNNGVEDKEAYLLIKSLGISCEFRCPCMDVSTPLLLRGYSRFSGIDKIKSFLRDRASGTRRNGNGIQNS